MTSIDLYIDLDSGADGTLVTPASIPTWERRNQGASLPWSSNVDLTALSVSTDHAPPDLHIPILANGAVYWGRSSTRAIAFDHTGGRQWLIHGKFRLQGFQRCVVGCFLRTTMGTGEVSFAGHDLIQMKGYPNGATCVLQYRDFNTDRGVLAHAVWPGNSVIGPVLEFRPNAWYWTEMEYDARNSRCRVSLHDPATFDLISESQCAFESDNELDEIQIGDNGHGSTPRHVTYFGHLVASWTSRDRWPLAVRNISTAQEQRQWSVQVSDAGKWGAFESQAEADSYRAYLESNPEIIHGPVI